MAKMAKYQQVVEWVHEQIDSGALHVGDKLETEAQLSERFSFSRQTIRQALGELEKEGTISRIQGSGSYVRNAMPRREAYPSSGSVTIISSYTDSYIFPRILQAMAQVLQAEGYSTRIMFTNNHRETERTILTDMLAGGSGDPVIAEPVTSALPNPNLDLYRELRSRGIPVIFFNTFYPDLDIPHVSLDDVEAGRLVTDYLISLKHTKIGCILKNDDGQGIQRYKGYLKALAQSHIPLDEEKVCWVDTTDLMDSLHFSEWILRRIKECTAVFCYNDEVAYMLTELCQAHRIRIPQDLSIASIDNSRLTELNAVALTSAAHPMEELGEKVAFNLMNLISHPNFNATYEFVPKLAIRESAVKNR